MAFKLDDLMNRSPYLFHLTYTPSLARIRRLLKLQSAAKLLKLGGKDELLKFRRHSMINSPIGDDVIVLTDQKPLVEGNIEFQGGWEIGDLVESINYRVFFWRGTENGLLYGDRRQFGTYRGRGAGLVFLRIPFRDAVKENGDPKFCRFNSGGPRCTGGRKSPHGPSTFATAENADFTLGKVREVVFENEFSIPQSCKICFDGWNGPWLNLTEN